MSAIHGWARVPSNWTTSSTMMGVIVRFVVFGLIGGWIGSRRQSLGTPAGFILGVFAAFAILLVSVVALGYPR